VAGVLVVVVSFAMVPLIARIGAADSDDSSNSIVGEET